MMNYTNTQNHTTQIGTRYRVLVVILVAFGSWVANVSHAGPTKTRFDVKYPTFARIFTKSTPPKAVNAPDGFTQIVAPWMETHVPWQHKARALRIPGAPSGPVKLLKPLETSSSPTPESAAIDTNGPVEIRTTHSEQYHQSEEESKLLIYGHSIQEFEFHDSLSDP